MDLSHVLAYVTIVDAVADKLANTARAGMVEQDQTTSIINHRQQPSACMHCNDSLTQTS